MKQAVVDCHLDGNPVPTASLDSLVSGQIARIVGDQYPSGTGDESAEGYDWAFRRIPLAELRFCNEDGEEPEGGWKAAYLRHVESDRMAVAGGSIEYAGRQDWLRDHWCADTAIYPLFLVFVDGDYRLFDGYHRLAGAFWHGIADVCAFVGHPKPAPAPQRQRRP